ncbi:MAG: menaquinone biosynthesis protein [Armatimonadetes bacterium]|nr:menaquinone biosynthesis protein [Armatimonadota bacterium]
MSRRAIGCVPFLNAKPLIHYFSTPEAQGEVEVLFAPPSDLAEWVLDGRVDAALASSFLALERPGLRAAPGVSISSTGPVESVRLFSKKPFDQVGVMALDRGSMTANHLARILLAEQFGAQPGTFPAEPDMEAMLTRADAAVLIGDAGMDAPAEGLRVLDLGAEWDRMTGLPFVWALWIGTESLTPELAHTLLKAKERGMERIEEVAKAESERLGWAYSRCLRYLAEVIDFDLTERHLQGLRLFADLCAKYGFIAKSWTPEIVGEAAPAAKRQ